MFDRYITAGRSQGWSDATARQYLWHLERWHTFQGDAVPTADSLRNWVVYIRGKWQPATVRAAIIAVRGWLRFIGYDDLAAILRPPTPPARVHRTVTAGEVARLLDAASVPAARGVNRQHAQAVAIRNTAIIAMLFDAWLRAAELCGLTVEAVSVEARRCIVRGKGDREEIVAFSLATAAHLRAWLDVRQSDTRALFVSVGGNTPGEPLTTNGLRVILRNVSERAGVPQVSPHAFRRGGATVAIRAGAPTRWVQAHGRWARLEMVELYTRALDPGEMLDTYSSMNAVEKQRPITVQPEPAET